MDTVAPSGCKTWVDICFAHLCDQGLVDFVFLIRWCRVSREWMDALKRAVRLMQQVSLPGGVTGEEALRALGLVAGGNVRFLRLRQCRNLIPGDIEEILHRLQATCLAVMEVDVTGCRDDVILRALSVRTISMVGGSPLDVLDSLRARCLQLLPMCKGEFSVGASAATRAAMAQQASTLLSAIAHDLDTLCGLGSP